MAFKAPDASHRIGQCECAGQAQPMFLNTVNKHIVQCLYWVKTIAHVKTHLLRNLGGFGVATYCTILLKLYPFCRQY